MTKSASSKYLEKIEVKILNNILSGRKDLMFDRNHSSQ
jgi:hypothetical protein